MYLFILTDFTFEAADITVKIIIKLLLKVQCSSLIENGPYRLICLRIQFPVGETVWKGFGSKVFLEEICHYGWSLTRPIFSWISLCSSLTFSLSSSVSLCMNMCVFLCLCVCFCLCILVLLDKTCILIVCCSAILVCLQSPSSP